MKYPLSTLFLAAAFGVPVPGQDPVRTELRAPAHHRTPVPGPDAPAPAAPATGPVAPSPEVMQEGTPVAATLPDEDAPMLDFARAVVTDRAPARCAGSLERLSFASGDWAPPVDERVDPELALVAANRAADAPVYAFVILRGQDSAARMAALRAAGAEPIEFHPYSAYKVRLRAGAVQAVAGLPFVRWVGFARTWQRTAPGLGAVLAGAVPPAMVRGGAEDTLALYVTSFDSDRTPRTERFWSAPAPAVPLAGGDPRLSIGRPWRVRTNGPLERDLQATGAQVAAWYDDSKCFLVFATRAQVEAILRLDRVHHVELARAAVPDHDQSIPMISQDEVRATYDGGGDVVAGVIDSGVDTNHGDFSFSGHGWDLTGDGTPWADTHPRGHGTHVAGTMLGTGAGRIELRGNARGIGHDGSHRLLNARLYRGDGSDWGSALDAFNYMAEGGNGTGKALVVNGSWHTSDEGLGTDSVSVDADAKAYSQGILWVFAAGNRGNGAPAINDPASAKNVLAVASVQDEDGAFVDGNWLDFGSAAVGTIAASSSAGPAADGRRKPNVAAPGLWIESARAGTVNQYRRLTGTSMAAPHVTGAAASLMQHYPVLQGRPYFLGAKLMANATNRGGGFLEASTVFGFGKINAWRSHWSSDAPGGWVGDSGSAAVQAGVGATVDLRQVPSDCTQIMLVTWHIESAPSTGAGYAVKNNVDVWLDRPPYTNGTNTGEYSSTSILNNIESLLIDGSAVRGQVLRLKLHPTSIRAGETVRVGYQCIMLRGSVTPAAAVTLATDKQYVKPRDTFRLTARIDPDSFLALNVLNRLDPPPVGFRVENMHLYLKDDVLVQRLLPAQLWQTVGDVRYDSPRQVIWQIEAPPYDVDSTTFRTRFWASNVNAGAVQVAASVPICVDGSAPTAVGNLESTTHQVEGWTNATRFSGRWQHATDAGCAGIAGYSYVYGNVDAQPSPDHVVDTAANVVSFDVAASTVPHWLVVRALDRAGNTSAVRALRFWVDTSTPKFTGFQLAGGATRTQSRLVDLELTASDTWSGVHEMRFSNDGVRWSPWLAYAASVDNWDLVTGAGGSQTQGRRSIWAEVRDRAGNQPAALRTDLSWN